MKRSIGVTISAILVLIGSLFWLAVSLLLVIAVGGRRVTTFQFGIIAAAFPFLVVGSLLGLVTSIGLFRLKRWARISLLIFASVLVYISVHDTVGSWYRHVLFRLLLVAIGGWWLYFFNKATIKAQFPHASQLSKRPISIIIIAALLLVEATVSLLQPVFHWPVTVFFGFVLKGWLATAILTIGVVISFYLGLGLLRLKERARKLAIGYLVYGVINVILFVVLPGTETRLATSLAFAPPELMKEFDLAVGTGRMSFWTLQSAVILGIQLWFLISRKQAFVTLKDTTSPTSAG